MSFQIIKQIFINEIKPPHYYNVEILGIKNAEQLFNKLMDVYKLGAVILFGDIEKKSINLNVLTPDKRFKLKQYMMSMGISTNIKYYSSDDVHNIYENFIFQINKVESRITVTPTKHKDTNKITNLTLNLPRDLSVIENLNNYLKNNREILDLLDVFVSKDNLIDHKFKIKLPNNNFYVLRFDYLL